MLPDSFSPGCHWLTVKSLLECHDVLFFNPSLERRFIRGDIQINGGVVFLKHLVRMLRRWIQPFHGQLECRLYFVLSFGRCNINPFECKKFANLPPTCRPLNEYMRGSWYMSLYVDIYCLRLAYDDLIACVAICWNGKFFYFILNLKAYFHFTTIFNEVASEFIALIDMFATVCSQQWLFMCNRTGVTSVDSL